jgi:hypothetical protein
MRLRWENLSALVRTAIHVSLALTLTFGRPDLDVPNNIDNRRDGTGIRCYSKANSMIPVALAVRVSRRMLCGLSFKLVVGDWVS